MTDSLKQSITIHGVLVIFALLLAYFSPTKNSTIETIPIELIEKIIEAPKTEESSTPVINVTKSKPQPKAAPANEVFGLNRKALTSEGSGGVGVKAGNTLAKEIDEKILSDEDPDSLPVPTEEYLITQMPKLIKEIKIPYPSEARKLGIQGKVILEILIDGKGKVRDASLVQGLGGGLSEAALSAIRSYEFSPAKIDQQNVSVRIRWAINFVLE